MNKILIMLSTYNGQKYIREQLDSLYNQENVEMHILARDDGSNDRTVIILKEYQQRYGRMTIIVDKNVGAAMSFYSLMVYAYENFPNYDFYSFSDQDDVWFNDKLFVATQRLTDNKGDLYYCNAIVTDSVLNKVEELGCKHDLSLQYLMFRQPALGCTQVMTNRYFRFCTDVFKLYIKQDPPFVELHDVWTMWISQMIKTNIVPDSQPHMLYRRHDNNVTSRNLDNIFLKMKRVLIRIRKRKGCAYANLHILGGILQDQLMPNASDALKKMEDYQDSILNTITFAFYMQKYFQGIFIKLMVMYRILNRLY